jgi:hypothetical protein
MSLCKFNRFGQVDSPMEVMDFMTGFHVPNFVVVLGGAFVTLCIGALILLRLFYVDFDQGYPRNTQWGLPGWSFVSARN